MTSPFEEDFRSPPQCRACAIDTIVRLEHIASESTVILAWHCLRCHAHWAPTTSPASTMSDERDGPEGRR